MKNNRKNILTSNGIKLINFYQKILSPIKIFLRYIGFWGNNSCIFYPTCSEYTKEAIKKYGILKGSILGLLRIFRCHPWQKNHIDPVRDRGSL
ncbi:MAG: membrane protein insertion efficiency factor YidD [Candidatus Paceibacterota bacterium]